MPERGRGLLEEQQEIQMAQSIEHEVGGGGRHGIRWPGINVRKKEEKKKLLEEFEDLYFKKASQTVEWRIKCCRTRMVTQKLTQ